MTLSIIFRCTRWACLHINLIPKIEVFRYTNNQENKVGRCGWDLYAKQEPLAGSSEHSNNGTNMLYWNVCNQLGTNIANKPEEQKPQIHCGRSLKSRMVTKGRPL